MSDVTFACPHCSQPFTVSDDLFGHRVACPSCQGHVKLPQPRESKEPPEAEQPAAPPPAPMNAGGEAGKKRVVVRKKSVSLKPGARNGAGAARGGADLPPRPVTPRSCGLATASLVFGLFGIFCLGFIAALPAVIMGHKAKARIDAAKGALSGGGAATAGLVLGYLGIVMSVAGALLLATVALPAFTTARNEAHRAACINSLRQIALAKEQWVMEENKGAGDPADVDAINQRMNWSVPVCPAGGVYSYNPVGERPTCSIPDHTLAEAGQ